MKIGTKAKLIRIGNKVQVMAEDQDFIEDRAELYKLATIIDNMAIKA